MKKISEYLQRAIFETPLFFTAIFVTLSFAPIGYSLMEHTRIFRYLCLDIAQSLMWSIIVCALLNLIGDRRWRFVIEVALLTIVGVGAIGEALCICTTGNLVSIDEINLVIETDAGEADGFFRQYFNWDSGKRLLIYLLVMSLYFILLLSLITVASKRPKTKFILTVILTIGGLTGIYGMSQIYAVLRFDDLQSFLQWEGESDTGNPDLNMNARIKSSNLIDKAICYAKEYDLQNQGWDKWRQTQEESLKEKIEQNPSSDFDIVMIIGESFIRRHSSLYGYGLATDSVMSSESEAGRVVTFDEMYTPSNFTTGAIRNIMSLNCLSDGEEWYEGVYFPSLFARSGWKVYHYDNQTADKGTDTGIAGLFYDEFNLRHTYTAKSDKTFPYDGEFLDYIKTNFHSKEADGKKFVIYHLKGQHFPAGQRYPGKGAFTADDIKRISPRLNEEQCRDVADYDNATHYTDSVIGEIISLYRERDSMIVYFSDHGEDIWDLGECGARNHPMPDDKSWVDRQYHIPFFVWMSDTFREKHPGLESGIRKGSPLRGTTDNLGQFLTGIAGIRSVYYNPGHDISSTNYHSITTSE